MTHAREQAESAARLRASQSAAQQEKLDAIERERVREVCGLVQGYESIAALLASERATNGQAVVELGKQMLVRLDEQASHVVEHFQDIISAS